MLILIFEIQNTALFVYRIYHIGSTRETKATWTKHESVLCDQQKICRA